MVEGLCSEPLPQAVSVTASINMGLGPHAVSIPCWDHQWNFGGKGGGGEQDFQQVVFSIIRIILLSRHFISQNPQPNKKSYELSAVSFSFQILSLSCLNSDLENARFQTDLHAAFQNVVCFTETSTCSNYLFLGTPLCRDHSWAAGAWNVDCNTWACSL